MATAAQSAGEEPAGTEEECTLLGQGGWSWLVQV
eukprot:COSAG02_NODE_31196_length_537_cov_3.831050_1_plen_33_part_01